MFLRLLFFIYPKALFAQSIFLLKTCTFVALASLDFSMAMDGARISPLVLKNTLCLSSTIPNPLPCGTFLPVETVFSKSIPDQGNSEGGMK